MNFSLSVLNRCDILGVNTAVLTSVYLVSAFWVFSLNPPPTFYKCGYVEVQMSDVSRGS